MALFALGCGAPKIDTRPGSEPPDALSLSLQRKTTDRRYTYFEVSPSGVLTFGGGRAAVQSMTESPGVPLTHEQKRGLWRIITERQLLDAEGFPFASAEQAAYDITLSTGHGSRSFRTIDGKNPGAAELHDALMKIHAEAQYKIPGAK
jgi:hypothetical protein